jgi:hypothetical protein
VEGVVVAYLLGHVVGFLLLGVALWRARTVAVWAASAVAVWPFLEVLGEASGIRALAAAGFALLAVGFGACAVAVARQSSARPYGAAASRSAIASTAPAET